MNKSKIVSRAILLVSFLNVGWSLKQSFHTNLFPPHPYSERHASIQRARQILTSKGLTHVGYITEGTYQESGVDYYNDQNAIAPIILRRGSKDDPMILLHPQKSHRIEPVPGFVMVEDLGNDLALFQKR